MIFIVGDKVKNKKDPAKRVGEVIEIIDANNTIYVEYPDGVRIENVEDMELSFEDMPRLGNNKTKFDEAGPLLGYGEPNTGKYHDIHYASMELQPIEMMQRVMTPAEFKGYLRGNIIKYCMRAGHKRNESREKDLDKANRYREWLLQAEAGLVINPRE